LYFHCPYIAFFTNPNTSNTFWKSVERNGHYKDKMKNIEIDKITECSNLQREQDESPIENNNISQILILYIMMDIP
jgi:hypothetical protein